jgi:glutamine synthetase
MAIKAEYIWIDGTEPTAKLRSKTKILDKKVATADLPIWGFDGSSTNQAPGSASDCVLKPVFSCADPIRGGDNILVMTEVLLTDMSPHPTNTRAATAELAAKYANQEPWFGVEQEYTLFLGSRPLGFPENGFPAPQGPYYCGVGADRVVGRDIIELHTQACIDAGLMIEGTNAEVMPGQWEFQVGAADALAVSDHLYVARWLLHRIAEDFDVVITFDPKPQDGDWNGAGCHTNFSTAAMREDYQAIIKACEAIGKKIDVHVKGYGAGIEKRLTGKHETAPYNKFSYGVSDRGASIRIPWQVERAGKGYAEDRRPNANSDPYTVTRLIVDTVCSAAAAG